MITADVPQVPHANVPALTIVYFVAFVIFAAAAALLFSMTKNAGEAPDDGGLWLRLFIATVVGAVLCLGAAFLLLHSMYNALLGSIGGT